ncbi:shikimate dehydrogenase [bacterium]|jgi:shikimate dehydrogenase|nr:shikimate dehydrogenase [bacterium]
MKVLLIGHPLGHSASGIFQNAGFSALGMDVSYENCDIGPGELDNKINEIRKSDQYLGCNITIPYKTDIIKLLDEIDDSGLAGITGAVNTVVRRQDGRLCGYNTDVTGFREAAKRKLKIDFAGKNILIVGAGGAGRAVVAAVGLSLEVDKPSGVVIADIDLPKAARIEAEAGMPGIDFAAKSADDIDKEIQKADLIINATPLGTGKDTRTPINTDLLHKGQYLFDVVYNPVETVLLKKAKGKGVICCNGLSMLFYQGWHAFRLWIEEYNVRSGLKLRPDNAVHDRMKDALKKHFGVDEL